MRKRIAYFILRVSLGVVFLIFGIGKFQGDIWAQTIKSMEFFQDLPWDTQISIYLIGTVEVATGLALITGLFSRFFSIVAAIQLLGILILLKFSEIRDIGLLAQSIYLAVVKDRSFGIGIWIRRKRRWKCEERCL